MQQTLPITLRSEPENKCLGCLFMKLEGIPVQPEKQDGFKLKSKLANSDQIDLYLTLQFTEQRELLLGGRIKFGLKGGQLRLKLENAEISIESRKLGGLLMLSPHNERQQHQGIKRIQAHGDVGNGKKLFASSETASLCQVTTKGSEENPTWVFQHETGEAILKGCFKRVKLGRLNVMAKPCRLEATFEVLPEDVYLTEIAGVLPQNISKKRKAVIERAIARSILEKKLKPYLSRQELRYE